MAINTETRSWPTCRASETSERSALIRSSISYTLLSKLKGHCRKKRQKLKKKLRIVDDEKKIKTFAGHDRAVVDINLNQL